ncbi:hypothetical protein LCGC14_0161970 [marine sediment metagenome]|uniref:EF-hand domain-containing protein n=1 Tax=marine sediment metagenome TaxID=412755 RepID=A0A0F9VB10_9ZZZZ
MHFQPLPTGDDGTISFETFVDCLKGRDDPLSSLFREHLLRWQEQAGGVKP